MDARRRNRALALVGLAALSGVACLSLGIVFELSVPENLILSGVSLVFLALAASRGVYPLAVSLLAGASIFVALTCSMGGVYSGTSPIRVGVVLGPWAAFLVTLALAACFWYHYERGSGNRRYPLTLFCLFVLVWALLSINVVHFSDWILENVLTVPFALLILLTHRWFRLSNISYTALFVFMVLHIIGTHYTYAEVPFGFWLKDALGLGRNHYDRIVHCCFGLLLAYPMREVAVRIGALRGFWALYVPVEFVLAFSAIYEIIEWLIAVAFGGDLGIAYLGTQGDEWDAIKDMALAGTGAVVTMLVVFGVLLLLRPRAFLREFRESLKVKVDDALGEEAIRRLRRDGS